MPSMVDPVCAGMNAVLQREFRTRAAVVQSGHERAFGLSPPNVC